MNEKLPNQVSEFSAENCPYAWEPCKSTLQNSIQTFIILWPVHPIHTTFLFWVIFEELPFCHFPPPYNSICGKDSLIWLIFHFNIVAFQTTNILFPILLALLQWPITKNSKQECFIGSKTTRMRHVVLNPIKHFCSVFKHYITLSPVQTMCFNAVAN